MASLPEKIFEHSARIEIDGQRRSEVRAAFVDTVSVMYAGWTEPVMKVLQDVYGAAPDPLAEDGAVTDPERAGLFWATAAHALDFDDVHTTSVTHPSAVLVPAIMAIAHAERVPEDRQASAYIVGLATNIALGEALGFDHYVKGWHATATIGPVAAAAALAHLLGADERRFRSALSIAVSQAAGTQRNFGSMAKPLHAGLAAAAGIRAARLALGGLTAADDAFGEKGFLDLYGGSRPGAAVDAIVLADDAASLSRKLYPCCYMAHRPIAAALDLRRSLDTSSLADEAVSIVVRTPYGCTKALRVHRPATGLEGKFSGHYAVASALIDGQVDLSSFEDDAVKRPEVNTLLERVTLVEDELDGPVPAGIDHGTVRIAVERGGVTLARAEAPHYPGSPSRPASEQELNAKMTDCLRQFHARGAHASAMDARSGHASAMENCLVAADRFAGLTRNGG